MAKAIVLFLAAGLAEIGGGYLVWLWLRESKPLWVGVQGGMILVLYGIIPTLQSFPNFGRVYAGLWRSVYSIGGFLGMACGQEKRPISMTGSGR